MMWRPSCTFAALRWGPWPTSMDGFALTLIRRFNVSAYGSLHRVARRRVGRQGPWLGLPQVGWAQLRARAGDCNAE